MPRSFSLWLTLSLITACSSAGQARSQHFEHAYAHRSCAPWDGEAVRIVLSSATDTARILTENPRPGLELAAHRGLARALGRGFDLSPDALNDENSGGGWLCDSGGQCVTATGGRLRLEPASPGQVRGSYEVEFPGHARLRGRFVARWLTVAAMCG